MRVISGSRKGIPLKSLKGTDTRPTSDKVKESIFNMIGPYFDGGVCAELFGGSGSLSIECLSRGARTAYIFEKNPRAVSVIKQNAEKCRMSNEIHIFRSDAKYAIKRLKEEHVVIDYLFIDPPYAQASYYGLIEELSAAGLLSDEAVIVAEHDKSVELPDAYGSFNKAKYAVYGSSAVSIYMK